MSSGTGIDEHIAFRNARQQAALAQAWRYNEQYENDLKALDADPQRVDTLSADHRSQLLGYYKPMRDAAAAAGIDVTGGNQR